MDPVTIPENLAELGEDDVVRLGDDIRGRLRHLAAQPLNRQVVDEMRELRAGLDQVNTRAAEIEDERNELAAQAAAAIEGIDDTDNADEPAEGDAPASESNPEPEPPADPDPEPTVEPAADVDLTDTPEPELVQATAKPVVPVGSRNAIAALRRRQATDPVAATTTPQAPAKPRFGFTASGPIQLGRGEALAPGAPFNDRLHFADTIVKLRERMGRSQMSGRSFEYVGHADTLDMSGRVDADPIVNFAALQNAVMEGSDPKSLVASGNLCPPDNPIYDFFRLAVPQAPVKASLPTVAAPRGGIRYIATPDFRAARAAIGTRTAAQNADPETPDKPCSRATCPTVAEAYVTAVSECVRWDNLTYRAFPELVANYMADVAVNHASVEECLYLTAIHSASTAVTANVPAYGALRALAYQLRNAAAGYRKRQNMLRDADLVWYAPNWMPDMLLADAANDNSLGIQQLRDGGEAWLASVFANLNIRPVWFNDQANCTSGWTGDTQAWRTAQGAGALNLFPTAPVTYLHAPGEFVRLDSGSLDVGLVRDSALNGTNDLELFAESWTGVVHLGLEAIRITHTLCPNGTAPDAVTPLTCP